MSHALSGPIHYNASGLYAPRPGYPDATLWIAQPPNEGAPASASPEVVEAYFKAICEAFNATRLDPQTAGYLNAFLQISTALSAAESTVRRNWRGTGDNSTIQQIVEAKSIATGFIEKIRKAAV